MSQHDLAPTEADDFDDEFSEEDQLVLQEADPNPEPVSYTATDFDVEGLVRRLQRGDIVIPTFGHGDESIETGRFQRGFVWSRAQMDRFIESLLLGYPIPGIFLVQQADKRYLVLDGQQRLRTLEDFFQGMHDKREFSLKSVADRFKGLTYATLDEQQRRTINNTFMQATIVKTDGSRESLEAVYQVFERLNSGGTQLTPHEIRVALYAGPFIDWITALSTTRPWRELYGRPSRRLRDQELVLRIVALYSSPGTYRRPLKRYLNDFAADNRYLKALDTDLIGGHFTKVAELVLESAGSDAVRLRGRQVNAALTEAIFVGLMRRLDAGGTTPDREKVETGLGRMMENEELLNAVSKATADEENVRTRLAVATRELADT